MIAELRRAASFGGDAASLAVAEGQLQHLGKLQRRLEHAGPGALASIRGEVLASVAATEMTTRATSASTGAAQNAEFALHAAHAEARRATDAFTHAFYEQKIFDPYLQFASAEDERAYREREEQRRREIEKAKAEGTPEGDLRALNLSIAQLKDAGAHGADQSPDYLTTLTTLTQTRDELKAGLSASAEPPVKAVAVETKAEASPAPDVPADVLAVFAAQISAPDPASSGHGVNGHATAKGRATALG